MSCGTAMCDICGHTYGVSWGSNGKPCPRCLDDPERAKKKGTLLPGPVTWLIRHASAEQIEIALGSQRKYPAHEGVK